MGFSAYGFHVGSRFFKPWSWASSAHKNLLLVDPPEKSSFCLGAPTGEL
jgi:hypothetical protein